MGADLYLPTVLHACHQRYGKAAQLIEQALALSQGQVQEAMQEESQYLKEALSLHARQVGAMPVPLFDLVTEIADLAQGELTVWTAALAEHIATRLAQDGPPGPGRAESGSGEGVQLARILADLLHGRPDAAIQHGAFLLIWLLQKPDALLTEAHDLAPLLESAGACIQDLQENHPLSAAAFLLRHRLLPALERACTDQTACLSDLACALEPLGPAITASSPEDATFTAGQTLTTFHHLASRLRDTSETLRHRLLTLLQEPAWEGDALLTALDEALAHLETLWQESLVLQPALEEATDILGALLLRTLPSPRPALEQASPTAQETPPLRRTIGLLLRHQFICYEVLRLLVQSTQVLRHVVAGERIPALREICRTLVMTMGQVATRPPAEAGPSLATRLRPFVATTVPLTEGITLVPGTPMDACFVQIMTAVQQQEQEHPWRAWVMRVFAEEPMTASMTGMLLRFLLLLQDEPRLWAELLVARLRETLPPGAQDTPDGQQVRALLEQCQGLLDEQPSRRLLALLADLRSHLAPWSPLLPPATHLLALAQDQTREQLAACLASLAQEGAQHLDWPEDRRQDFCGLVELAQHLLETPDEQCLPLAIRALAPDWRAQSLESGEKAAAPPEDEQAQQARCLLTERLSTLPEPGPQPPCADPRLIPNWRLHLLRALRARYQARSRQEADGAIPLSAPDSDAGSSPGSVLEPILLQLQRMVHAWRFPPEGYFRDPYNDASILWIAAGLFWPHLADALAETREEPDPQWRAWLPPEHTTLAPLPLPRMSELRELLRSSELRLPSRAQLARWGAHTIRLEEEGPYGLEAWYAFFARRKEHLLAFFDEALARQEPILCSL